jgi:hypothetical protein
MTYMHRFKSYEFWHVVCQMGYVSHASSLEGYPRAGLQVGGETKW